MSKKKLAGIIAACVIATIVVIVLVIHPPFATPTYTLSVNISPAGAGSVSTLGGEYESGVQVTLTATPASGYAFDHWEGGVSDTSPTITITMNHDYSITANFEAAWAVRHNLTISSTGGGSVTTPGEGAFTCGDGTMVNLVAEPDEGYHFVNWTGDIGTVADVEDVSTTITMNGNYSITANFAEEEAVYFADPNLQEAIREAISKPSGPIYLSDLEGLTNLPGTTIRDIVNLAGLEHCASLTKLYLGHNQISDISPLANLTNLTYLSLYANQISDISPLTNLTNLTHLHLSFNQISDISPLANLTNLQLLYIDHNQISDIKPLVMNPGLSAGDTIYLWNPLSDDSINIYIPQLEARGVSVRY